MGYNNHSEIGWVLRDKDRLFEEAREFMLKSPENYYNEGKTTGKLNRGKGIDRLGINSINPALKVTAPLKKDLTPDHNKRVRGLPNNKFCEIPQMFKKSRLTDIPAMIKGIRYLRKK